MPFIYFIYRKKDKGTGFFRNYDFGCDRAKCHHGWQLHMALKRWPNSFWKNFQCYCSWPNVTGFTHEMLQTQSFILKKSIKYYHGIVLQT